MITKVEASGYRCLREVSQDLQPYQILVGPNGSGKSAFLDVIAFLGGAPLAATTVLPALKLVAPDEPRVEASARPSI